MFEVWSEGKAPSYSPMTTSLKPGTPDLLAISWSQYGGKTGIWRFMRIFDDTDVKATVCLNAKAAEMFPDAVKQLHERGPRDRRPFLHPGSDPSLPLAGCRTGGDTALQKNYRKCRWRTSGRLVQSRGGADGIYGWLLGRGRIHLARRLQRHRPSLCA